MLTQIRQTQGKKSHILDPTNTRAFTSQNRTTFEFKRSANTENKTTFFFKNPTKPLISVLQLHEELLAIFFN